MAAPIAMTGIRPIAPTGIGQAAPTAPAAPGQGAASFAEVLKDMAVEARDGLKNAESLSMQGLSGKDVDTRQVVDAVMSAEQSLNAAIAIRDKIVTAYLEISRMQI